MGGGSFDKQLLNTKSLKIDLAINGLYPLRALGLYRADFSTADKVAEVIRGMPNSNTAIPDSLLAEFPKLDHLSITPNFHNKCMAPPTESCCGRYSHTSVYQRDAVRDFH